MFEWVDDRDDNSGQEHHRQATHGSAAFLRWVGRLDRDVAIDDLSELYQEWQRRRDAGEQADLTGWSE